MANLPKIPGGLESITLGQLGADWIDNTTPRTGDWMVITALTNTVFTTLTGQTIRVNGGVLGAAGNLNGKALAQGLSLYGRFSAITLASGSVVAYAATPPPRT